MRYFLRAIKNMIFFVIKQVFGTLISLSLIIFLITLISVGLIQERTNEKLEISKNTYVYLAFPDGIEEKTDINWKNMRFDIEMNFLSVIETLESIRKDTKVEGLILDLDQTFLAANHIEEISEKLREIKRSGKKIYAFANYINKNNYYLGVLADEIYMSPSYSTSFSLGSYSLKVPYYKKLGDKLGVEAQVINIGDFKSLGENYIKEGMSKEFRENYTRLLDNSLNNFITKISQERKISKDLFETNLLNGEYLMLDAKSAKVLGLIDSLSFYDDFLEEKSIDNISSLQEYYIASKKNINVEDKIAVIIANGEIRMESDDRFSTVFISPDNIIPQIDLAMEDESIKGVVLRVNSPGGSALASEIILDKLIKLNNKKPVYVSMSSVAASGGYYISSNASKIFAEEQTITGSIGVVSLVFNIENFYKNIGLNFETIEKGRNLSLGNINKRLSAEDVELIRKSGERTYQEFKNRVIQGRNIDADILEEIAQGKVWTGLEAKKIGLVDEIGGVEVTINSLAKHLNLSNYEVINLESSKTKLDMLFEMKQYIFMDKNLRSLNENILELKDKINFMEEINGKYIYMLPYEFELK